MMTNDLFMRSVGPDSKFDAPPINNLCVPDIYNKLDANVIERTRVINTLLDTKLKVQQKVLTKYKLQAEQMYKRERDRIRHECVGIRRRLPNVSEFDQTVTTKSQIKKMRKVQCHVRTPLLFTTTPREIKGIPAEKDDRPFCNRYVTHHLPIQKTKSWYSGDALRSARSMFNPGVGLPPGRSKDRTRILLESRGLSASENCLATGPASVGSEFIEDNFRYIFDNDDAMTI